MAVPRWTIFLGALLGGAGAAYALYRVLSADEAAPEELLLSSGDTAMPDTSVPPFPYVEVEPGYYLRADAGRSYLAMKKAAKADGVDILLSTAYRSLAWQTRLWNAWQAYKNGTGPWAPLAAKPDGSGPHQRGLAVDLHGFDKKKGNFDAARNDWMQKNAARFGWFQTGLTFSVSEPWHWYFKGAADFPLQPLLASMPSQKIAVA